MAVMEATYTSSPRRGLCKPTAGIAQDDADRIVEAQTGDLVPAKQPRGSVPEVKPER